MKELKDTINLMLSDNYIDRFKAEYYQLLIRYDKLKYMVAHWNDLDFVPICDKQIYNAQLQYMLSYIYLLQTRAIEENIQL